jgi:acyl-CoA dehydrogenase
MVVMGVTDPDAPTYQRHSMILIPRDAPGVSVLRNLTVFGYQEEPHGGRAEILFDGVRVPAANLLGTPGAGFAMAQARLGPGRIHHCMRLIGMAERALDLTCRRAVSRTAFGRTLAEQGVVQESIAQARLEIEQLRLLVLKTAWLIDTVGARAARIEISAIKVAVPRTVERIIDDAIQIHGSGGLSQDFPLAMLWSQARMLRLADGPDQVHRVALARQELKPYLTSPQS